MTGQNRNSLGAFVLIGLGVLFLAMQVFDFDFGSFVGNSWPLLIVGFGALFLALAVFGGRDAAGFVFPGAIIGGTGLILAYQNTFNHWESWAYAWTLYPVFMGLALLFHGVRTDKPQDVRTGRGFLVFGVIAFVIGWAFFELLLFNGNGNAMRYVVPAALIGIGGYLLLNRRADDKVKNS